jgi:hypothetical protein
MLLLGKMRALLEIFCAECHYVECNDLCIIMLSVVAPLKQPFF